VSGTFDIRAWRTMAAVLVTILAGLAAGSSLAQAAAPEPVENTVINSSPATGTSVNESPPDIIIGFAEELNDDGNTISVECENETVLLPPVEVLDDSKSLRVEIRDPLPKGTCLVTWGISATDTSPAATGVISFIVETASVEDTTPDDSATTSTPSATTPTATDSGTDSTASTGSDDSDVVDFSVAGRGHGAVWLGRLLSTIGIATLFGALLVITAAWPEGVEYLVTIKFLRAVWIVALIGTLLFTATAASVVTPDGGGSGFSPATWLDLLDAGWAGRMVLFRLVLLLASAWVAFRPDRAIDPTSQMVALGIPALCAATLGISRTVGNLPALGVLMGVLHALAMSVWVGGVILLARVVLSGPGEEDLVHAVRGFGRVSAPAIGITIATGVVQMIRLDGGALFDTGHSRVVLLKAVIVAVMIFLAISARQFVATKLNRAQNMTVPLADRLRRAFGAEAGLGLVTLAASSWLLAFVPSSIDVEPSAAYAVRQTHAIEAAGLDIELRMTDDEIGLLGLRVDVREAAEGLTGLVVVFTAPANDQNVGSIRQPVPLSGTGVAIRDESIGLPISVAGNWTVQIEASTAAGVLSSEPLPFPVKDDDGVVPSSPTLAPPVSVIEVTPETPPSSSVPG
jgi:methionine-rich copper-binding protein CopC